MEPTRRGFLGMIAATPFAGQIITAGMTPKEGFAAVKILKPKVGVIKGSQSGTYPLRGGDKVQVVGSYGNYEKRLIPSTTGEWHEEITFDLRGYWVMTPKGPTTISKYDITIEE